MSCTVAILVTLDTKGEEAYYVKEYIEEHGHKALVIDCGTLLPPAFEPDINREEIKLAAGAGDVSSFEDEGQAVETMTRGASIVTRRLCHEGKIDGIIAIGGSMGTSLALPVLKGLPFGIPRLVVSTIAFSGYVTSEALSVETVMMQSPADMWGLNSIIRMTLANAAAAITCMAEVYNERFKNGWQSAKTLIGMTTLGTALCTFVPYLKSSLEARGYELAVFHAPGMGTMGVRAVAELIQEGHIKGLLDMVQLDLLDGLCKGYGQGEEGRIDVAAKKGIPLVIAPGSLHSISWDGPASTVPEKWRDRIIHQHNSLITAVGATHDELAMAARVIAEKASKAQGPVAIVLPRQGFSEWDKPGGYFHDPKAKLLVTQEIKKTAKPNVSVIEVDANINDTAFTDAVLDIFNTMMK